MTLICHLKQLVLMINSDTIWSLQGGALYKAMSSYDHAQKSMQRVLTPNVNSKQISLDSTPAVLQLCLFLLFVLLH